MTEKDANNSVHDEQFGNTENNGGNIEQINLENSEKTESQKPAEDKEAADETVNESSLIGESPISEDQNAVENEQHIVGEDADNSDNSVAEVPQEKEEPKIKEQTADESHQFVHHEDEDEPIHALPRLRDIDYTKYSKEDLVSTLRSYMSDFEFEDMKDHAEAIKSAFYKMANQELDGIKAKFLEDGGLIEDFKVIESPLEIQMKDLLNLFREKRNSFNMTLDEQKEINLKSKYEIIEAIKELINSQESLNKTFHDFRNLQEKWREIGPVPQKNVKDLWESYHYHVEAFYDYIKINKELRDLDFKKNLDAKVSLCEKAEELLLEQSVVEAFRKLQILHDQWREVGPVPAEKRTEIWDRFRDATSKINHRHQEYFVNLKDEQKNNLQEKTLLCEKVEQLVLLEITTAKDWEEKSKELIELQRIWKTIGFAPKKHNTKIYERFRAACDKFFDKKREFFSLNREEQENNLQLKTELCIQAEGLQNSTDWKKTTDELIKLQKRWKTIGPVPAKNSEKIWKRFRAACDNFFNNKSKFFENIDSKYDENLKLKQDLIKQIETFELTDDENKNLDQLKEFQRQWSEIGFVPIKIKEEIQEQYRQVINAKFDMLNVDDDRKSLLKFRNRIESMIGKPNADRRIEMERDKCYNKLKQLESDITLWENNIGFFSNSKNAKTMITDVEQKIEAAKVRIQILKEKINIIDEFDE